MTIEESFADYQRRLSALGVVAQPSDYFKAGYLFGAAAGNQFLIALGKYAAGYRPGDEMWAPADQEALDLANGQIVPIVEAKARRNREDL